MVKKLEPTGRIQIFKDIKLILVDCIEREYRHVESDFSRLNSNISLEIFNKNNDERHAYIDMQMEETKKRYATKLETGFAYGSSIKLDLQKILSSLKDMLSVHSISYDQIDTPENTTIQCIYVESWFSDCIIIMLINIFKEERNLETDNHEIKYPIFVDITVLQ